MAGWLADWKAGGLTVRLVLARLVTLAALAALADAAIVVIDWKAG